jgi:putative hydrolase of the HAD superfamily
MAGAFERTLEACGRDPEPGLVSRLVARDAELLVSHASVFADTVPFLAKARAAGLGIALVSNCAENTRAMLAAKGLLDLADAAILSCEAGIAKPDPEIYALAVQALGVLAADAVMLDDQPRFCAGAKAAGLSAIQVARPEVGGHPPDPRFRSVPTLLDALPLLSC